MYYHKAGYPEEDELVTCTVNNVQYNSVFVKLNDYNKTALIHISEVSPGRIRNLRDYVKPGKVIVCKVLRVNEQRGHIDVSLRRVNEAQRRMKVEERKAEQKAEKIIETLAAQFEEDPKKTYDEISKPVLENYGLLNYAFTDVVENDADLKDLGVPDKYAKPLQELVKERIQPSEVAIEGDLNVTSYATQGVDTVKKALKAFNDASDAIHLRYLGSGTWRATITAPEFKEAEQHLKKATEAAKAVTEPEHAEFSFTRKE
ncbi:S1 RNA-binding domain-containing protein [Candidatus Woesearchaeota archaeon]|nr:S1 RNA-binding domain-containing protein [Candidatus Woesearchaeota archaeon]